MVGRLVGGISLVCLLLGAAAWLGISRLNDIASRESLATLAGDAWGGPAEIEATHLSWFPPTLRADRLRVDGDDLAVEVERVELRPDLASLLFGTPRFASLVLVRPTLRIVLRDPFVDALRPLAEAEPGAGDEPSGVVLPVDDIQVEQGKLLLEGLPLDPSWTTIGDIELSASAETGRRMRIEGEGTSLFGPVQLEGLLRLGSGTKLELEGERLVLRFDSMGSDGSRIEVAGELRFLDGGEARLEGVVGPDASADLRINLLEAEISPLSSFVSEVEALRGRATGSIEARGPLVRFHSLSADLSVGDAEFRNPEIALAGGVRVRADLSGPLTSPEGTLTLDARDASLRYRAFYEKEPGTAANLRAQLYRNSQGGLALESWKLRVEEFRAEVR